jgi:methyl-accepting chemotaxis protein
MPIYSLYPLRRPSADIATVSVNLRRRKSPIAAQQAEGKMDHAAARAAAINEIAQLRYSDDNYIWISDLTPVMVLHPINAELNGRDVGNLQDPTGKRIFSDAVTLCKQKGGGVLE